MRRIEYFMVCAIIAATVVIHPCAHAEEGGGGHYVPGLTASFVDALPGKPGLAMANYFSYYDGDESVSKQLPFGGLATAGLTATAYSNTVVALYRTPWKMLGGSYVVGVAIPYVWMTVKGEVQVAAPGGGTVTKTIRDTADGIGDIMVYPFMLGWTALGGDLKYDVRMGVYAPTGEYKKNRLANVGKNYWTFEPVISASYINSKMGLEVSAYAGMDFNTKNNATEYQTGDQFHIDVTAAQHLPFPGGLIGVGANGFYYEQVSGDSGAGAILGDFKGRTMGVGPVVSYVTKVWQKDLAVEIKWLPELDVSKRTKGDYIWFKLAMSF